MLTPLLVVAAVAQLARPLPVSRAPVRTFGATPLLTAPIASGERLLTGELPPALDGRLGFAYRLARAQGHPVEGLHWLLGESVTSHGIHVAIVAAVDIDEPLASSLEASGCTPDRLDTGALASVGPVVEAWCTWDGLWASAGLRGLKTIVPTFDFELIRPVVPPRFLTLEEIQAPQLSESRFPEGGGANVVVADIDSGVDVFHPFFFRADGGLYRWIDSDDDGVFTPGVDGVDFDGNGELGEDEILRVLKSHVVDEYLGMGWNFEPDFIATVDWLYQDENLNARRDFGPQFGDARPTFGEPMYLVDDLNGNLKLDVGEKLVRLHTPKLRAVRNSAGRVFRRDVDLSQAAFGDDSDHGTMVLGSIGGGVRGLTRYTGVAPDADLLLGSTRSMNLVSALAFARSEGAHIVLWEMSNWYGEFLDGSSPLETACDAASGQGVLQVGAAGNLGTSQKHLKKSLAASSTVDARIVIPAGQATYVYGNFLWRGTAMTPAISLTIDGSSVALSGADGSARVGSTNVQWGRYASPRGTQMVLFYLAADSGQQIAGQTATFRIQNTGSAGVIHGYMTDNFTAWSRGVYWPNEDGATDYGTYGTPGTSDETISIATYFATVPHYGQAVGDLVFYSGKGPRIDGAESVDFAAPEDLISAWYKREYHGSLAMGAGTSNASPVAVGVFALLKSADPDLTPAQLVQKVRDATERDAKVGAVPNDDWGWGRVRAFRAHHRSEPTSHGPPIARGTASADGAWLVLDASASADPEGSPLRYRWDLGYDGTWDVALTDASTSRIQVSQEGVREAKLEVADAQGRTAQVIVAVPEVVSNGAAPAKHLPRAFNELRASRAGCAAGPGLALWLAPLSVLMLRSRRAKGLR